LKFKLNFKLKFELAPFFAVSHRDEHDTPTPALRNGLRTLLIYKLKVLLKTRTLPVPMKYMSDPRWPSWTITSLGIAT
jgi:hypothetical protein